MTNLARNPRSGHPLVEPTIRQIRSRTLASLRDQSRTHRQRQHKEALDALRKARAQAEENIHRQNMLIDAIAESLGSVVTPVIASFGIEAQLCIRAAPSISLDRWVNVHTDYSQITVTLNPSAFLELEPGPEHLAGILTVLKGLIYHEAGHILFSVPLIQVIGESTLPKRPDEYKYRRGDPRTRDTADDEHRIVTGWAYSILDDQRMECALAAQSPVIGHYLTKAVEYMILHPDDDSSARGSLWPFICGRSYLPQPLRESLQQDAIEFASDKGLTSELEMIERIAAQFVTVTTREEMLELLEQIAPPLQAWFRGRPTFSRLQYSNHSLRGNAKGEELSNADGSPDPSQNPVLDRIKTTGMKNEASQTADQHAGSSDNTPGPAQEPNHPDKDLTSDAEVQDLIHSYNTSVERNMPRATHLRPMTAAEIRTTEIVRNQMLDLVFPLLSHADPAWQFRQDDGILDPVSYRLRDPGASDFWSQLTGVGTPGPDMAISLLLDVSASMLEHLDDLFTAAIGVRKACDQVGFPCTVLTFSDRTRLIFDAHEPTRDVVALCQGGTNPRSALEDLPKHRHGKQDHLVIAFTDGHWFDTPFLDQYRTPGTVIVGVTNDHSNAKQLRTLGFDDVVYIRSTDLFAEATAAAILPLLT